VKFSTMPARAIQRFLRLPPRARVGILLLAAAAVGWAGWSRYHGALTANRIVADGSIEATTVDATTRVPGRVLTLVAPEGREVKAGAKLAELEPQEANAQVTQARAAVAQAEAGLLGTQQALAAQQEVTDARVAQAKAQIAAAATGVPQSEALLAIQERTGREAVRNAQAQLSAAQAQATSARSALTKARDDLSRTRALFAQGAVAAQNVDAAQAAYDAAVAQSRRAQDAVTVAQANLATAQANLLQVPIQEQAVQAARANLAQAQAGVTNAEAGYTVVAERRQEVAAAQAALAQAQAALKSVELSAGHNTITAPLDGIVQSKNVEEGEVVPAGAALYTLVDPTDVWIRIFIPESRIGLVRVGQQARVAVDTLPGQNFAGRVTQISTQPEFTTVNVQTKQDRVKLLFGVKVRLTDPEHRLRPGMPAHATIFIGSPPAQAAGGSGG
jgi:HlyD family secretion protein